MAACLAERSNATSLPAPEWNQKPRQYVAGM
jgi:hypothetical protein